MIRMIGDKFIVTKTYHGRGRIERFPVDMIGRVGTLIARDGAFITLEYPGGLELKDGTIVSSGELVEDDDKYYLEKVTFITEGKEPGPYPGTVMLDVEPAYSNFWGRFKKGDPRRNHNGHLKEIKDSIAIKGLRHPIIMNNKNELRAGAYRLAAYHALGIKKIPAYITDTDKKRSYRL